MENCLGLKQEMVTKFKKHDQFSVKLQKKLEKSHKVFYIFILKFHNNTCNTFLKIIKITMSAI